MKGESPAGVTRGGREKVGAAVAQAPSELALSLDDTPASPLMHES
jgi:hypothetical protein